jgi:formyl-CoA transferase
LNRNKRALCLNLRDAEGRAILRRLVATADVLIENFRPAVKHRLGIDYVTLAHDNPRLVYVSISGFGEDGPYAERPGFDQIAQAMGGLMSITGEAGRGPMRAGIAVADLCAGLFAAYGALAALLEREVSGRGQWVKTSLLAAQIFMLDFQAARYLKGGEVPGQDGNYHATIAPCGAFRARDGQISLAVVGATAWRRFCAAIERPEIAARYASNRARLDARAALHADIEAALAARTRAEWIEILNDAGIACGPIYAIDEVFADAQVRHLRLAASLGNAADATPTYVAQPIELSRTPSQIAAAAPAQGEHTDEILAGLGYDQAARDGLRQRGVI